LGVQLFCDKKAGKKAGHPYLMIFGKYKNHKVCNEMMQNERPDPYDFISIMGSTLVVAKAFCTLPDDMTNTNNK
jgi:hypothetical protein